MAFNNLFFLFIFMPLSILIYYIVPSKAKRPVLLIAGLLFYSWGGLTNLIWLGISIVFNWLTGVEIGVLQKNNEKNLSKIILLSACAANIFMLCIFKYATEQMPLGLSFFTFTVISYLCDIYRNKAGVQYNLFKFALYVSFFPKIVSGPIVRYEKIEKQLEKQSCTFENLSAGMQMFVTGLFKKVIIADRLSLAFAGLTSADSMSVTGSWLGVLLFSLQLYYDFSGYSDMAIGLSKIFGFDIDPNFDYPYFSLSLSEFWRRWHISLGEWFKNYVYFPLGGNRISPARTAINIMAVWILTGLWHGSTLNFLLWGIYNGLVLLLEKFVLNNFLKNKNPVLRLCLTLLAVGIGWVFFFSSSSGEAFIYIGKVIGIGASGFADNTAVYYFLQNIILIVIALLGCSRLVKNIYENIFYRNEKGINNTILNVISVVITAALLIFTVSELIGGTYSTFMYAQF